MIMEKDELTMAVACLGQMETFLDTMIIPAAADWKTCPIWAKTTFPAGYHIDINAMIMDSMSGKPITFTKAATPVATTTAVKAAP